MEKRNDTKKWVYNILNSLWYKLSNTYVLLSQIPIGTKRLNDKIKTENCNEIGTVQYWNEDHGTRTAEVLSGYLYDTVGHAMAFSATDFLRELLCFVAFLCVPLLANR